MNAALPSMTLQEETFSAMRLSKISYDYTSFFDRQMVIRFLGDEILENSNELRDENESQRSVSMLFGLLGDSWVLRRNSFLHI
ncbi:MAG: DUF3683 domain-containing protein [Pseudomonadota bacterium]|nr:DUF3683 domain-containing protein [Pseudomonadota bacterium]MDO7710071.1 DUF3683 domain-containing protein [Pseudomonadota bacterium]